MAHFTKPCILSRQSSVNSRQSEDRDVYAFYDFEHMIN